MFDEETATRAATVANKEARLLLRSGSALSQLLPDVSRVSLFVLRQQWRPYKPFEDADGTWGLELQADRDPMVKAILRDAGVYDDIREIGEQALIDEMASESFMTSLLGHAIL